MVLLTILFLFVITQWSSSLYLPLAPTIASFFKPHQQWVVSSLSWFFSGYAIGQLFWGTLSDYIGRYLALFIALLAYMGLEWTIVHVQHPYLFVLFLSLTGFFISANTSVGNALIKDRYAERSQWVLACVGVAMACAPVIAPLLSSLLYGYFGWRSVFGFLASLAAILLILVGYLLKPDSGWGVPVKEPTTDKKPLLTIFAEICKDRLFVWAIVVLAVMFGSFFSLLLILPFLMSHQMDLSVEGVSHAMFALTGSYIIGSLVNFYFSKKLSALQLVKLGLVPILTGSLFFILLTMFGYELLTKINLLLIVIVLFGIGLLLPAAKAMAMLSRKSHVGTAASLMKFVQTLGCVVLTKIAAQAIAADWVSWFLFGLALMVCLISVRVLFSRSDSLSR